MSHRITRIQFLQIVLTFVVFGFPLLLHADCSLSIDDPTQGFEGGGGANIITFTVTKTGNSACSTLFSTSDQTATGGGQCTTNVDYGSLISGGLNFSATETSKTIVITTCGDSIDEPDETFVINLHTPGSGATYTKGQGRGTLIDDDPAPDLRINNKSIAEGNAGQANLAMDVTLSNPSAFTVTVDFATSANTATAGANCGGNTDFITTTGSLSFNPLTTNPKTITIPICGDTTTEPNETFRVNLSNAAHANLPSGPATATITNDDVQVNISINDIIKKEGDTAQSDATFTVSLSGAPANQVTVNYTTVPVAPTVEGVCGNGTVDYVDASGTLTFNAGSTAPKTIPVHVCGDTVVEANDLFNVNLSAATNANISDNQGKGSITNDDLPTLSIAAVQKNEGGPIGTTTVSLTVTASSGNPAGMKVTCIAKELASPPPAPLKAATGGTACGVGGLSGAGTDFVLNTRGTLATFGPNVTTATCTVTVCADGVREPDEAFNVVLSNPQAATIANGTTGVVIKNDD